MSGKESHFIDVECTIIGTREVSPIRLALVVEARSEGDAVLLLQSALQRLVDDEIKRQEQS